MPNDLPRTLTGISWPDKPLMDVEYQVRVCDGRFVTVRGEFQDVEDAVAAIRNYGERHGLTHSTHGTQSRLPLDDDRPRRPLEDVEWWLGNNYGPHVNSQALQWIREMRAEIARLQALVDERHPA